MSCTNGCQFSIGTTIVVGTDWAGCVVCNADTTSLYPREATYQGFSEDNQHLWILSKPTNCPNCGNKIIGVKFHCHDNGGGIELPLLIELPERVEK